jgi:DNA-binding helix-hairpin-helix protein with protein kinase domain
MTAKAKVQLYNSQGQLVSLASELGSGGEGRIFEVRDNPGTVAKVYHKAINHEKAQKLSLMVNQKTERLLRLTAWPVDTLHDRPGGSIAGLLMPRVVDHKEIHVLYGVKSRLADFPDVCWPFLIHTAANIARAFAVVHEHGQVIGDVNHASILVARNGTVRLIDCDSFQIVSQGRYYLCLVGVPTHTPPELQDKPFNGVVRTANHDAFGLAVIIFQMLFMGRHPFSGWYAGPGDMPLKRAIKEYRFAYGARAASYQMKPPPGTLPLEAVSEPVAKLFEAAFSPNAVRPKATEWIPALTELSKNLKQCGQNNGHHFLKTLPACPWCKIEVQAGIIFFNIVVGNVAAQHGTFNLISIWSQIAGVPAPGQPPALPDAKSFNVEPSQKAMLYAKARRLRTISAATLVVIVTAIAVLSNVGGTGAFWIILVVCFIAGAIVKTDNGQTRKEIEKAKQEAERCYHDLEQRWRNDACDPKFQAKFRELESKKAEHQSLPGVKQRKLQQLQAQLKDRQLYKYLDSFKIDRASIGGVGPSRKATLQSYGIETAADVTAQAILAVPGFGPSFTSKLIAWRRMIELRFVFDPSKGIDPSDLQAVEREITGTRLGLEKDLANGPSQLRQIGNQIQTVRGAMRPALEDAQAKLAQAAADWTAVSSLTQTLVPIFVALGVTLVICLPLKAAFEPKDTSPPSYLSSSNQSKGTAPASPLVQPPSGNGSLHSLAEQQALEAQKRFKEGVDNTKAGRYSEAVKAFQQAIALKQDYAEANHELGYALLKLKKYDEATAALKRAIGLNPKNADTYHNLGLSYMGLERWPEAISALKQTLSIK